MKDVPASAEVEVIASAIGVDFDPLAPQKAASFTRVFFQAKGVVVGSRMILFGVKPTGSSRAPARRGRILTHENGAQYDHSELQICR
jgi:hypothetical protein